MHVADVFSQAIFDRFLIYAPLHHLSALVNMRAAVRLRSALATGVAPADAQLAALFASICAPATPPAARSGQLNAPFFLGILPTRRCNMVQVDHAARRRLLAAIDGRRTRCATCFCRWHCAGDCYVRACSDDSDGDGFSTHCRVNRRISLEILLWAIMQGSGVAQTIHLGA